jgi:hypothetical protein
MQLDKLQIELRPRSHAQALDLGFALLRSHAGAAYKSFLVLWLPLVAVCGALVWYKPELGWLWGMLAWWFKPLLERAPLYVLSRQVFGTTVTWQEALRAWPRQLGGGTLRMLLWGRILISSGRSLWQPVWQLESARGKIAAVRLRVLGADGTGMAAFAFGAVCATLEVVLEVGLMFFLAMFASDGDPSTTFRMLFGGDVETDGAFTYLLWLGAYAVASGIITPIYTACGFTLYLNRRAKLEAWDLEIQLRQIRRPIAVKPRSHGAPIAALAVAALLCGAMLGAAPDTRAAETGPAPAGEPADTTSTHTCKGPTLKQRDQRAPANAAQAQVRKLVDQVYAHPDLRGYECVQVWRLKEWKKDKDKSPKPPKPLNWLADILRVVFIAAVLGVIAYLFYRFRDRIPAFRRRSAAPRATEVGGLDIRAESLPADVAGEARALWERGERRAALALLYRATLSRLVSGDGLLLRQGDTEGDCLRAATALRAHSLSQARFDIAATTTTLWLNGAYGDRWPSDATVHACCRDWDAQFGASGEKAA